MNSNYMAIRNIISQISGQNNTFTVPKLYVDFTGDLTTAILLNQIVFLSDKTKRKDGFFYKTYKEWTDEICLTERQVRYSVKKLKEQNLIETKVKKANGSPTVHYKLNFEKLVDSLMTFCQNGNNTFVSLDSDVLSVSLTETTTENVVVDAIKFYQENFGMITPFIAEDINLWIDDLSEELVTEAMKLTLLNGTRNWSYAKGILRDWLTKNIRTLEDVEAAKLEFKNKNKRKGTKKNIDWEGFDTDE